MSEVVFESPTKVLIDKNFTAYSWGWNSGGRCGNITETHIKEPKQVQRSQHINLVECAAGKNHSLLLSDEGIVFSIGEGRKGQLGYGNIFTFKPHKGGKIQATPRQITPSGESKFKRDLQIIQIDCGSTFSVARECAPKEGTKRVRNFQRLEQAMQMLITLFPESDAISRCWAIVRQERYVIDRTSEGLLLAWGTGEHGQLGLGRYIKHTPFPRVITKFLFTRIVQIAAGDDHTLAIDDDGRLYSWGSGKSGKLGHGDFEDRFSPEQVTFFATVCVDSCAAGDAHSAVLTSSRRSMNKSRHRWSLQQKKDPILPPKRRIATFGRGAHGRLGNGTNLNTPLPVLVSVWPPSLEGVHIMQVACGGAHTLALVTKPTPVCLANPWGYQTFVVGWGYGSNGQLGDGFRRDSFVPVKARMPKTELVVEVAAGRSWSMARTNTGALFTWGKGLRGQLGQGENKFLLVPHRVDSKTAFVKLSGDYAHSMSITVPRKFLNEKLVERVARAAHKDPSIGEFNPFVPIALPAMRQRESSSLFAFHCCRRISNTTKSKINWMTKKDPVIMPKHPLKTYINEIFKPFRTLPRFRCDQCELDYLCKDCVRQCHQGHPLSQMRLTLAAAIPEVTPERTEYHPGSKQTWYSWEKTSQSVFMQYKTPKMRDAGELEKYPRDYTVLIRRFRPDEVLDAVSRAQVKAAKAARRTPTRTPLLTPRDKNPEKENKISQNLTKNLKTTLSRHENPLTNDIEKREESEIPACPCGLFNEFCRVIPMIKEVQGSILSLRQYKEQIWDFLPSPEDEILMKSGHLAADKSNSTKSVKMISSRKVKKKVKNTNILKKYPKKTWDDVSVKYQKTPFFLLKCQENLRKVSAMKIQRLGRRYIQRVHDYRAYRAYELKRHEVCEKHYYKNILGPIFNKFDEVFAKFREQRERTQMQVEETLTSKFLYYNKLQKAFLGLDALYYGVKKYFGSISIALPRRVLTDNKPRMDGVFRPSFTFTYRSIRELELVKHPSRRVPPRLLAKLTRHFPRYIEAGFKEGMYSDIDVNEFTGRHVRDLDTERWRRKWSEREEREKEIQQRRALMALEKLKVQQAELAEFLRQAKNAELQGKSIHAKALKAPRAPSGPLPPELLRSQQREEKEKKKKVQDEKISHEEKQEDWVFNPFDRSPVALALSSQNVRWRKRRHSLSDPCVLYSRIIDMRQNYQLSLRSKRRNSVPCLLSSLAVFTKPPDKTHIEQIKKSLEFFKEKKDTFTDLFDLLKNVTIIEPRMLKSNRKGGNPTGVRVVPPPPKLPEKMRENLFDAPLNPRLPRDMTEVLRNGMRRRTIAEPERLSRQLEVMMDFREKVSETFEVMRDKFKVFRRHRSFDLGEMKDRAEGVEDQLGMEYEESKTNVVTQFSLVKDAARVTLEMNRVGMLELSKEQLQDMKSVMSGGARSSVALQGVRSTLSGAKKPSSSLAKQAQKPANSRRSFIGGKLDPGLRGNGALTISSSDPYQQQSSLHQYTGFSGMGTFPIPGAGDPALLQYAISGDESWGQGEEFYNQEDNQYQGWEYPQQGWDGQNNQEYDGALQVYTASVWQEHYSEGYSYYYNEETGESSWDFPPPGVGDAQLLTQHEDESGQWYWFNNTTGESTWM